MIFPDVYSNFYSVLTVSNLSNMLKCVLLLRSDCVYRYVRYCNEIISIINKIILQSSQRGRTVHCVVAKRPGGETSWGRNVQGAKRPGGELTKGRNVQLPHDLFVHCRRKLNSPVVSSPPLSGHAPEHIVWPPQKVGAFDR